MTAMNIESYERFESRQALKKIKNPKVSGNLISKTLHKHLAMGGREKKKVDHDKR